eukprot:TRINITY_DN60951_c0_g1_i1.p3 TRINITY_DN60951_c0_g1~~TRINITY_DN60951_c0_g1_i1.p3  ORF type:complete len:142 (+),score=23.37 TRINITY_DN60951_c0_g1_i1:120-545(+)
MCIRDRYKMEGKSKEEIEKKNRVQRCYEYMTKIKALFTPESYSDYLLFMKLMNENYLTEKVRFYALVAFGIFFPSGIQEDRELRKSLFLLSKSSHVLCVAVSYTHLRAHETSLHLVCRLLLEKKNPTPFLHLPPSFTPQYS